MVGVFWRKPRVRTDNQIWSTGSSYVRQQSFIESQWKPFFFEIAFILLRWTNYLSLTGNWNEKLILLTFKMKLENNDISSLSNISPNHRRSGTELPPVTINEYPLGEVADLERHLGLKLTPDLKWNLYIHTIRLENEASGVPSSPSGARIFAYQWDPLS